MTVLLANSTHKQKDGTRRTLGLLCYDEAAPVQLPEPEVLGEIIAINKVSRMLRAAERRATI
jgi:hypothetical protein